MVGMSQVEATRAAGELGVQPASDPHEPIPAVRDRASDEPWSPRKLWSLALRSVLGVGLLFGAVAVLASFWRHELEALGRGFVDRFGLLGMSLGTLLADGLHFPVPPQFYMLMAIISGGSQVAALVAISIGSMLGGATGFTLSRYAGRLPRVERWLERSSRGAHGLFERYGYRAVVLVSVLPVAYSMLCYLAGLHRLPRRVFVMLSVLRIPRLLLFYYLIRLGWMVV